MEQREDPSLSDDPFMCDDAVSTLQDDGQWDRDDGGYTHLANNGHTAVSAVNVEELRAEDYHDRADDGEPDGGGGDMGFDPTDYEGIEELPSVGPITSLL